MVNKSLLLGIAIGAGFAVAGGVTAYQLFGGVEGPGHATAIVDGQVDENEIDHDAHAAHGATAPEEHGAYQAHAAQGSSATAAPAPAPAADPVAREDAPAPAPAAVREECYEETVAAEPRDKHRIAGTTIGAIVGGAVAKDVGDRDLTTAVGAAVGAFAGNKIQQRIQERRAQTATEVRCVPVQ
ncbi:MAG TPA: glycine zipper domain-containing protein [Gammaproteobacteria bacterium]